MQIRSFGDFLDAIVNDHALEVISLDVDIKRLTDVDRGSSFDSRNAPTENQSLVGTKSLKQSQMNVKVLVDSPSPSSAS